MKPGLIKQQLTPRAIFGYALATFLLAGPLLVAASIWLTRNEDMLTSAFILMILAGIIIGALSLRQNIKNSRRFTMRNEELLKLAAANKWQFIEEGQSRVLGSSSLLDIAAEDRRYFNTLSTKDWGYTDVSYGIYRETKNGRYKHATGYYAVLRMELPRTLPNVLFDSPKLNKDQFEILFDPKQKHRLEGGFERYFNTYFAEDYTIDSLSFITPEVMEALVQAADYDVEIIDNHLLMYGHMYDPESQIRDMVGKLGNIKKHLVDNIDTYRDDRLPYSEGRKTVAAQGLRLKRRGANLWAIFIALVAWVIFEIVSYKLDF